MNFLYLLGGDKNIAETFEPWYCILSLPKGNTNDRTPREIILIIFALWSQINKYVMVVILLGIILGLLLSH